MLDSGWLRRRGQDGLEALLRRRPELCMSPPPRSIRELAERMLDPQAVVTALRRLDLPTLQVAEALAGLGGDQVADDRLERLLGVPATTTSLDVQRALTTLEEHGLVRRSAGILLVAPAREAFGPPLGLGPPAGTLLALQTAEDLRVLVRNLGLRAPARKAELLKVVHAALCDPERVRSVLRTAPSGTHELLVAIANGETDEYAYESFSLRYSRVESPRQWAMARGLLVRAGQWDAQLLMPAEVGLVLRGPAYSAPFDPRPPELTWTDVDPAAIRNEAIAAAADIVRLVADLMDDLGRTPLTLLRSGGVGVRDLRRLAKNLSCSMGQLRLALTLAESIGLLALSGGSGWPTDAYDDWRRLEPADRAAVLLSAWWRLPRTPSAESEGAWQPIPAQPDPRRLRQVLLGEAAGRPGQAPADPAALAEIAGWHAPYAWPGAELVPAAVACWQEAAMVGVGGANALSPIGHALLAGDQTGLREALEPLGSSQRCVRIQADLTAVVTGTPGAQLADLLDSSAEREARGVASVWRFTPSSVRRALDGGQTAAALLTELEGVSSGPLPQPLRYLINDVARRHGAVRACEVASCLRSEDTALLAELAADRRLRGLGLRALAPTVLASTESLPVLLTELRKAGYGPVAEAADGTPTIERAQPRRTSTQATDDRPRPRPGPIEVEADVPALVQALLAGPDVAPTRPLATATLRAVAAGAPHLSGHQSQLLARAIDQGTAVRIDYVNAQGRSSRRVIEAPVLAGAIVIAWCRLREDERMFNLGRIITVATATGLDDSISPGQDHLDLFLAT